MSFFRVGSQNDTTENSSSSTTRLPVSGHSHIVWRSACVSLNSNHSFIRFDGHKSCSSITLQVSRFLRPVSAAIPGKFESDFRSMAKIVNFEPCRRGDSAPLPIAVHSGVIESLKPVWSKTPPEVLES